MLSLLNENDIPAFVQDGSVGGALPGVRIEINNIRRIVVPRDCANQARAILAAFAKLP